METSITVSTTPAQPDETTAPEVRAMVGAQAGKSITLVIPVFNEMRSLDALAHRIQASLDAIGRPWSVVFVNDGSRDNSWAKLRELNTRDPRFEAISFSRNFGKEIAVAAGLQHARGDAVVIMDSDLQHPPEVIKDFVARWDEGYEVVYGQRRDRDTDTGFHRLSARIYYNAFRYLSGTELPEGAGDFRLMDRKAVDALNTIGERARFNKGLYAWIGFKSIGVLFDVEKRHDGQSRWQTRRLLSFAIDGLASFTTIPLRVWSYLGLLVSLFAFVYSIAFVMKTLMFGVDLPGFPTLIVAVMMLAGVQLISLGVIGEYLGRVYEEVKGRPLYIVSEKLGLADSQAPSGAPRRPGSA